MLSCLTASSDFKIFPLQILALNHIRSFQVSVTPKLLTEAKVSPLLFIFLHMPGCKPQCHCLSALCWKLVCSCLSTTDFWEVLLSRIQAPFHKAWLAFPVLWHTTLPLAVLKTQCVWMCLQSKLWEIHYHLPFCWQLLSVTVFLFTSVTTTKALHSIGIRENTHWNQSEGPFSCHLADFLNQFHIES